MYHVGPSFMSSSSSLVLGLWQFPFVKYWPEIQKIRNTNVWVLPIIWRLGRVKNTKFGTNVSNEMLLRPSKCQGCSFYPFWVIKGRPTVGVKLSPTPRLGLIEEVRLYGDVDLHVDIVCVVETKIDKSFPSAQLSWPEYHKSCRLDISDRWGRLLVDIKSHLPSRDFTTTKDIQITPFESNQRKKVDVYVYL